MEQSKAGARDNPDNHVILPFTRMLGGMMDDTPGGLNSSTKAEFISRGLAPMVMGIRAHHLTMYAIYDAPTAYKAQPSFPFIKDVPAAWDESRSLAGVPREHIVTAGRSSNDRYVGAITKWTPRDIMAPTARRW